MRNVRREGEVHGGTRPSPRCGSGATTPRKYESTIIQCGSTLQVRVFSHDGERVVLELCGELDVVWMAQFERLIAEVLSGHPEELSFDVTQARFISVQGYAAMGRCSPGVRVTVRSRSELASRVLTMCGYDQVMTVMSQPPARDAPN